MTPMYTGESLYNLYVEKLLEAADLDSDPYEHLEDGDREAWELLATHINLQL